MLSITDAELVLNLLKDHELTVRLAFPYTPELMQVLRQEGYLPVLEQNAWNEKEIVVSVPKRV